MRPARVARLAAVIAVALVALGIVLTAPASAHSRLISSNPADGAVLAESPSEISFTFDEELIEGMNTISINDDSGTLVASEPVQMTGTMMSVPLTTPLPAGSYQAAYRVVSADGHAVMGSIAFTVAVGASGAPSDQPSTASSTAAPATPMASSEPTPGNSLTRNSGLPWAVWLIGAAVVVVIVVLVVTAVRRAPKDPA